MAHKNKIERHSNKWDDMDENLLLKIFASLTIMEILYGVSRVCKNWKSVAKDHILHIHDLNLTDKRKNQVAVKKVEGWTNLKGVFARFVRASAKTTGFENLTGLVFDMPSFTKDVQLLYAAQRCPNLKNLKFPSLPNVSLGQLAYAFKMWPKLESFAITFSTNEPPPIIFQSIGQNCIELKSLNFRSRHFFTQSAEIITNFLPNLKVLSFWARRIQDEAVLQLLKNSTNLQEMYIAHKDYCNMEVYQMEGIITICSLILLQNEAIVQQARRLRVFHVCKNACCDECPNPLDDFFEVQGN